MAKTFKNRGWDYLIFGLSVFLVFCLIFEGYIELPVWVSWLGRWHPALLHFPIVLLVVALLLEFTRKGVPRNLLLTAVIFALVTAISGFFLGKDHDPKGDLLYWHQWLGGGVALLAAIWYGLEQTKWKTSLLTRFVQVVLVGFIGFAGHYGGMVTHGEDFLAFPGSGEEEKIPENPLIYQDVVGRILKKNCVSCHNPNKKKGELLMTSRADLLKGGESGHTVIPRDPGKSELIRRLQLPEEDEEHMPPEGKKPLSETEIGIIERWIALGASDTLRLEQLDKTESLVTLVRELMEPDPMEKWAGLPPVADSTLQNLASDYLTVQRVANGSDAIAINAYLPPEYNSKKVEALQRIAGNIVYLDLSGLPLGTAEIKMVAQCENLERLELDGTTVTDSDFALLPKLGNLQLLKVYQTELGDRSIPVLEQLVALENLYLWETNVSEKALEGLHKSRPDLRMETGLEIARDSVAVPVVDGEESR